MWQLPTCTQKARGKVDNFGAVSSSSFWGNVAEPVAAEGLQGLLGGRTAPDTFQVGFRSGFGTEAVSIPLTANLCLKLGRTGACLPC